MVYESKITLVERPNFKLWLFGLVLFLCFFAINFYLFIVAVSEPLWSVVGIQSFLLCLYIAFLMLRCSKIYTLPRMYISQKSIELESGKLWGVRLGPTIAIDANSIGVIELKFPRTVVPAIIAELQHNPRKILNLAIWVEEGKDDWLPRQAVLSEMLSIVERCPAYQSLISMGYKVILPHSKPS